MSKPLTYQVIMQGAMTFHAWRYRSGQKSEAL
jgi:hypothetical protein